MPEELLQQLSKRAPKYESSRQFHKLLDALPAAAYTCDSAGLITYFNRHAEQLWGRAPKLADPADRYCGSLRLFAADGQPMPHAECWMAKALSSGQEFHGQEAVIERPDGTRLTVLVHVTPLVNESGEAVGAVNMLVDITARKQADDALLRAKNELAVQLADMRRLHGMSVRLSTTLELQPLLNEVLHSAAAFEGTDMGILSVCDPHKARLCVGASLGFGEHVLKLIDSLPHGSSACATAFRDRCRVVIEDVETDPRFAGYLNFARAAGFRAVHSTPLISRTGKVLGVLSTHFRQPRLPSDREIHLLDMSARLAADHIENAQLFEQLSEADRRKDEFLAMLAHELRNPLAPISNSLHILKLSDDLSPTAERLRDIMEQQVNSMVRLVDDLMEVSRISRGKIELRTEPVELVSVIRSAVETSRPLIEAAGHQLAISASPEPMTVEADAVRLAQVVANLLNNAAKYTPAAGQIWLTVKRDGADGVVSVRDNGLGIPPDVLSCVFEMFAQADRTLNRSQGGLGIGLTLARTLVQLHGGRIEARSEGPGRGSEFIVRLPLLSVDQKLTKPAVPTLGRQTFPSRNILVVDDTQAAAYILGRLLETMGQKVHTAADAVSALEQARAQPPDMVISDIAMPTMDGYELARRLRQEPGLEKLRLVALTGYGQESDRQRAKEAGFDYHLVKPVSLEALREMLSTSS